MTQRKIYQRLIKRPLDLILSLALLTGLSPILLILAVLIRMNLGSPILFTQERPGLNEKIFKLFKFRTMTDACDEKGELLPDERRLTRFGRWLRATSLDELPELWNVVCGEMSLVGPRPLLTRYLSRYSPEQARRHLVRPGLTGWAQINGRNAIDWEQKLAFDVWYADHCSLWIDAKILMKTLFQVMKHDGIHHEGSATMPEFMGTAKTGVHP